MSLLWRPAQPFEDGLIEAMCLSLFAEDPGEPMSAQQVQRTLAAFRAEPWRGRAVVAERGGQVVGYALLVSFWSNEYGGGEVCVVDELYVQPSERGQGTGTRLFDAILEDRAVYPVVPVAIQLEVTPANARARALYERLGFKARNLVLRRRAGR